MTEEKYGVSEVERKQFSAVDVQKVENENRTLKIEISRLKEEIELLQENLTYWQNEAEKGRD